MEKLIAESPLGKGSTSVRLVEAGVRPVKSRARKYHFARFIVEHGKRLETVEFLSADPSFGTLDGVVGYDGHMPTKTAYLESPAPTAELLASLAAPARRRGILGEEALSTFMLATSILTSLIGLVFMGRWIWGSAVASRDEEHAKVVAEQRLNQFLFKGQSKDDAAFDIYKTTVAYIHNLINGKSRGVILYGSPGTSKTYIVRRTLFFSNLRPERDYTIVKGSSASAEDNIKIIYSTLYKYNGKIIVFDDFDSALSDENVINLLKAALDSYPIRIVAMPNLTAYSASAEPLPSRFEFNGRIIIITNKARIDSALLSRTQSVAVNFTNEQLKDSLGLMLQYISPEVDLKVKQEVYDFLIDSMAKDPNVTIDFRRFSAMVDLRMAYPDSWKTHARGILYPTKK
jgi:hypothetical protein